MVNDEYTATIRGYAMKCEACRTMMLNGADHVHDRALLRDGMMHLYRVGEVPICEDPK
jgi:hypothetical protein